MKRFVISEDERARILSMHESATKRQYLSEQPAPQPAGNDDKRDCKSVNVPNNLCGIYNDAYQRLDGGAKKGFYYDWNKYPGMFVKGTPDGASFIMEFYAVYPGVFYGLPSLQSVGTINTGANSPEFNSISPQKNSLEAADSNTYEGSGLPEMLITNAYKSWFNKYGNNLMAKKDQILRGNLMSVMRDSNNKDNKYLNIMRKYFNIGDNA